MNSRNNYNRWLKKKYRDLYLDCRLHGDKAVFTWGSHHVILENVLKIINTGDVMELGMGYHSTPFMHKLIEKQNGRKLLSLDESKKWAKKFMEYSRNWHLIEVFDVEKFMNKDYPYFNQKWSVVFIDVHPPEARQVFINAMIDKVDYFIVHDTENIYKKTCAYKYDFTGFKHVFNYGKELPMTSVLTNRDDIPVELINLFK
jgi:hypothetical protein